MDSAKLDIAVIDLPARRWSCTFEEVAAINADLGLAQQRADVRVHAIAEWAFDLQAAARLREQLSLSEDQHLRLLSALKRRNEEIWGSYSEANCLALGAASSL